MNKNLQRFFALLILLGAIWALWYFVLSLKSVTINFRNIEKVSIYSKTALDAGSSPRPIVEVTDSGQVIKLRNGNYTLYYQGESGYESRYQQFKIDRNDQSISTTASLSESRLEEMAVAEATAVLAALAQQYPNINLYEVQPGKIYRGGDWYGTTLVYKGPDVFNFDTLRVVLHKEAGEWVVKTNPPAISLNKYDYPDVPRDILSDVNKLSSAVDPNSGQ